MKAAVVTGDGLKVCDAPDPRPGKEQVLVRVRAAGMNRADLTVASGKAHGAVGGVGAIPGIEWAGEIVETGPGVEGLKAGDRVMCSGSNAWAELAIADMGRAWLLPREDMGFVEAATLPVALQTMHDALVTNGRLKAGETVLIQGASSGVGLMGLQIAKRMGARLVLGTSTNAGRRARLKEFGAHLAIDTSSPRWADEVLQATDGRGVDLIIDQVSASVANENLRAAAIRGRIVNVGRLGGAKGEFDFDLHAMRRIDYIGVTFRTRTVEEVREITRRMREDLWADVAERRLALPLDRTFTLGDIGDAVSHMRTNAHFGKIVLEV